MPILYGKATVAMPLDKAFAFFIDSFGSWWPADYRIGQADMADAIIEPREADDGTNAAPTAESATGAGCWPSSHPTGWSSHGRSTASGSSTPTPQNASEIEVRFTALGPDSTIVELEHRHLERLVAGQVIHDTIGQGGGWPAVVEAFAKAAESGV